MKKIWAPWRKKFIRHSQPKGCIFCEKPKAKNDSKNLILHRQTKVFLMMNLYPYNNGHLLISPYRHIDNPAQLSSEEWSQIMGYTRACIESLGKLLKPHGFNLGMNIGRCAGAGYDKHMHQHIVPRWNGDTNFMPVISNQKVISESLAGLYKQLKSSFPNKVYQC